MARHRIVPGRLRSHQLTASTVAGIGSAVCKQKAGHDTLLGGSVHTNHVHDQPSVPVFAFPWLSVSSTLRRSSEGRKGFSRMFAPDVSSDNSGNWSPKPLSPLQKVSKVVVVFDQQDGGRKADGCARGEVSGFSGRLPRLRRAPENLRSIGLRMILAL